MDEPIPWMNHAVWAEDINNAQARYYCYKAKLLLTIISYVDQLLWDEFTRHTSKNAETPAAPYDLFHQRSRRFTRRPYWLAKSVTSRSACHIPLLVSWPAQIPAEQRRDDLVCLTDLFGIATSAASKTRPA